MGDDGSGDTLSHLISMYKDVSSLSKSNKFDLSDKSDLSEIGEGMEKRTEWSGKYQKHLQDGDGNAAVDDIVKGYKDGILTKDQAIELANGVQEEANKHGGGRINDTKRDELKTALGLDYDPISKGKTRGQLFFDGLFSGIGSVFKKVFK
jgi:hypothetical protein